MDRAPKYPPYCSPIPLRLKEQFAENVRFSNLPANNFLGMKYSRGGRNITVCRFNCKESDESLFVWEGPPRVKIKGTHYIIVAHELNITLKYLMGAFNKINKHFYFLIFRRFFWDRQSA